MGNAVYSNQVVCYDTVEACKKACGNAECIFANECNGAEKKYVCLPIDWRFMTWLIFGCFLVVLLVCSSLVACYVCRAVRRSLQWQMAHSPHQEVVFHRPGPVHHIELDNGRRKVGYPERR